MSRFVDRKSLVGMSRSVSTTTCTEVSAARAKRRPSGAAGALRHAADEIAAHKGAKFSAPAWSGGSAANRAHRTPGAASVVGEFDVAHPLSLAPCSIPVMKERRDLAPLAATLNKAAKRGAGAAATSRHQARRAR